MSAEMIKREFQHPETVMVKADNDAGYIIINNDDFDPKVHKEYKGKVAAPGEGAE